MLLSLPPVREKEIVPLFGELFQLTSGIGEGGMDTNGCVTFERLPARNRPANLSVQPDSLNLFLQRMKLGATDLHDACVIVEEIQPIPKSSPLDYIAKISVMDIRDSKPKYTIEAKKGDFILIRDQGHLVRKIVSRDDKAHILGWVELDPLPVPETELIKKKVSIPQRMTEKK